MSPSEDQLRAALRDGEGPAPDANRVIGRAVQLRRQRRERRNRVLGAVAAVVVVGGLGFGLAHSGSDSSAGNAGGKKDALAPSAARTNDTVHGANGGAGGADLPSAYGQASATTRPEPPTRCPAKPVRYALAGGGGTGQFGSRDPLAAKAVSALTFCSYDADGAQTFQSSRVLSGAAAQQWIDRADASTVTSDPYYCLYPRNVEVLVTDTSGNALEPLSVTGGCQYAMVTNGTAVRFVPLSLLDGATGGPLAGVTPPPSGMMSGSPRR